MLSAMKPTEKKIAASQAVIGFMACKNLRRHFSGLGVLVA
jgi:hypothetical protein